MRRLRIPNDPITIELLKAERNRTKDKNIAQRIDILLMLASGESCINVAACLVKGTRTIERTAHRFLESGLKGLANAPKGYKPPVLTVEEQALVAEHLRKSPREFGYNRNGWDGILLSHHIQMTFGKQLKKRQCQRWFHRLGFRLRKPRPVISKGDPVAQEECKKNSGS